MTSILGSIAERIWASTQSLPSGPPFNAYVEQLRGLSRELRTYVNHMESRLAQDARKSLLDSPFEVTTGRPGLVRCRGCHSGWSAPNQSFCSKCQESASRPKGGYQCTACGKPSSMDLCPLTSDGYHRPFGPVSLADAADITTKRVEAGTARTTQFKPEVPKDPRISAIETPKDQNIYTRGTEKIRDQLQGNTPETSGPKGATGVTGPTSPKSEPRYVQCISCGQEAQQGLTSPAKPCWLGPSHVWEPVSLRERILEPKKMRKHILLTAPGEQVPVARLTPDQARELGIQLIILTSGHEMGHHK